MERSTWQCRKQSELQESSSGDSWFMSNSRAVKAWRHGVCRTESAKIVTIRWWKRQKPTACGWMTICFICSAYSLSVRSGTRTLRLMICSLGQRKWSRGSRQCECWEPRLFCIGGLLSGYGATLFLLRVLALMRLNHSVSDGTHGEDADAASQRAL